MKKKMSNRDKTFWAVIIPVVILFFAFNTLPMIKGVIYSFTNYKGYGTYDYVGFRNYADLFMDSRVGKSYLFTFKYALAGTILVNVLSLIMAVGLNSAIRFKSALRGIYFVPNILGGLVIGYIFSFIFTRSEDDKIAARLHGIDGKLEFLGPLFVIREVVSAEVHPA